MFYVQVLARVGSPAEADQSHQGRTYLSVCMQHVDLSRGGSGGGERGCKPRVSLLPHTHNYNYNLDPTYKPEIIGIFDTDSHIHHGPPPHKMFAVAQYATRQTPAETMELLEKVTKDAARVGVELILFPEAFLGGYPRTCKFGVEVGSRSEHGREQYFRYWQECVDLGDSCPDGTGVYREGAGDGTRERLERIARETHVFLVVGVVEKCGGTLYCACVFVDPKKGMVGKRRKVMPVGSFYLNWMCLAVNSMLDRCGEGGLGDGLAENVEGCEGRI